MKIQIINGPNLNLLGVREPGIYGSNSFESYLPKLKAKFPDIEIEYFQSNIEGELINKLQEVGFSYDGVVLNAGAYTHTSIMYLNFSDPWPKKRHAKRRLTYKTFLATYQQILQNQGAIEIGRAHV